MKNIWVICRREIKSYFVSWVAYILIAVWALIYGFGWAYLVSVFAVTSMDPRGGMSTMNVNEQVIVPLLLFMSQVALLFLVPLMTMRLFAEEKNRGTIELLLTSPIRDYELVVGKWLGSVFIFMSVILVPCLNIAIMYSYGKPDWKPILAALLGFLLQGAAILAIGTFISTLTKNQINAAFVTYGVVILLWIMSVLRNLPYDWLSYVAYYSIFDHGDPFIKLGVIALKDVVFLVSFIFLGLFLATRSLESLRWRT